MSTTILKYLVLMLATVALTVNVSLSQITPPGLGKANTANWLAFGMRQKLDTADKWQSVSYIGIGRKSNPDNFDPLFKPAIIVFNQEFYHQFHKNWQYSFALSYRRQDEYADVFPFEHEQYRIKQELRVYGRIAYCWFQSERMKLVTTFRQDIRTFYQPDFTFDNENLQFRSRLRLQLTVNLTKAKNQRLVLSSEQLFSTSNDLDRGKFSAFGYRESRFSLYYSLSPATIPLTFNIGYMNNLVTDERTYDVHYLGFDIVLNNPFPGKSKKR